MLKFPIKWSRCAQNKLPGAKMRKLPDRRTLARRRRFGRMISRAMGIFGIYKPCAIGWHACERITIQISKRHAKRYRYVCRFASSLVAPLFSATALLEVALALSRSAYGKARIRAFGNGLHWRGRTMPAFWRERSLWNRDKYNQSNRQHVHKCCPNFGSKQSPHCPELYQMQGWLSWAIEQFENGLCPRFLIGDGFQSERRDHLQPLDPRAGF